MPTANRTQPQASAQRILGIVGRLLIPVFAILMVSFAPAAAQKTEPDVVYVGTPYDVVSRMLKMARVTSKDVIYDLGCGDGRMIVLAAKKYGCRGTGFDIDPERVAAAQRNVKRNRVERLVKIVRGDLFRADFSRADVLSLYLLPDINVKLLPQFEKLKPGSRLVFHDYGLEGIKPDERIEITSNEDNATHTIYLYTTPLKKTESVAEPQARGMLRNRKNPRTDACGSAGH